MATKTYKYDGAISFLKRDEALALQIREALAPLDFFVYSKEQEALAGQDGVGAFRDVFRNQARVSLVLFRAGWAETPWTRVEEAAIRDHCLDAGWEHLMFVRVEKGGEIPKWVPDSYIYLDFQTFGLADLVGATKAKCAKLGIELRAPRAIDKARAIADQQRFDKETKDLMLRSPEPFHEAATALFDALDESFKELGNGTGWQCTTGRERHNEYVARLGGVSLHLYSHKLYANCCDSACLAMHLYRGVIVTPQERARGGHVWERPKAISNERLQLARTPQHGWCWASDDRPRSIEDAAAYVVERVLNAQQEIADNPFARLDDDDGDMEEISHDPY